MAGSIGGTLFRISTWGESHGKAVGVVLDGCPAGLPLCEEDIQPYLDRRSPGKTPYASARQEADQVELLSGTYMGQTTGTPLSLLVRNTDAHSEDYQSIAALYRPGHADYGYDAKYGFRDPRGGGRSSGRETIGRVAAGAVAAKLLGELGITVQAYTESIGSCSIQSFDSDEIRRNPFCMPDASAAEEATALIEKQRAEQNSLGGVIGCLVRGMPAGIGEPVFDKLDAALGKAILSIGAVKGVEIGDGFAVSRSTGKDNNDAFRLSQGKITKESNHAGGILGGISDGSIIRIRAAVKPTPSIAQPQETVGADLQPATITITGRHDPVIVPRAVVVVECMVALVLADALLLNLGSRMDTLQKIYNAQPQQHPGTGV